MYVSGYHRSKCWKLIFWIWPGTKSLKTLLKQERNNTSAKMLLSVEDWLYQGQKLPSCKSGKTQVDFDSPTLIIPWKVTNNWILFWNFYSNWLKKIFFLNKQSTQLCCLGNWSWQLWSFSSEETQEPTMHLVPSTVCPPTWNTEQTDSGTEASWAHANSVPWTPSSGQHVLQLKGT